MTDEDCQKKAADLGFDLTKQFLTLAFAGIAFVVGLSFNTPGSISSLILWLVIGVFGASAILGLVFLMRGVNLLSVKKNYDIYASSLRVLAVSQILLMLVGVVLLVPILNTRPNVKITPVAPTHTLEIRVDAQKTVVYPIDPEKSLTIEVEGTKVKVTAAKK